MMLITGHKGFIGSKLAKKFPDAIGLDIQHGSEEDVVTCELPEAKIVYHLASYISVEESFQYPMRYADNLLSVIRLVDRYPDSRIIFASSAAALKPKSPYGFSKRAAVEYLKTFHKDYVICTFPNVFGGGVGVVDSFKGKDEVTIYGDGDQVRDFVHVDDIVEGLLLAKDWPVGVYLMGSGTGTKIKELAVGKKVNWAPARIEERTSILINNTPDWKPSRSVLEYMQI